MTVEPFEINSFKKFIDEATGNVLLVGCGLGYVAYMLSLKEDVKSITVVDINEDVLNLFYTYILPQFENKDKVKIIKSDGIEYLKSACLNTFDHINVDIWYDVQDMIYPYLRCLRIENIEKANSNVKFSYWLEEELKENIQKAMLCAISGFKPYGLLADKISSDIVKNTIIKNYDDIYNLLNIKDIRSFLYSWYINNINVVESQESIDKKLFEVLNPKDMDLIDSFGNPKTYFKG